MDIVGHCDMCVRPCVCMCLNIQCVCVFILSASPYVWAAICAHAYVCACLCPCGCTYSMCMSASPWRCGQWTLYFCIECMPGSLPVSHSVVSSSSQQQAGSQPRSLLNTKCTFPAHALRAQSFLVAFDSCLCKWEIKWISCCCGMPLCVGKGDGCATEN